MKKKKISNPIKQKGKSTTGKVKNKFNKQVHKKKVKLPSKRLTLLKTNEFVEDESDQGEDLLGMVDQADLDFLKKAVVNRSYTILNKIKYSE